MAIAGLKLITLALRDKETGELLKGDAGLSADGLFPVTTAMLGSKSANITNISANGTPVYGNNSKRLIKHKRRVSHQLLWTLMTYHSTLQKVVGSHL